MQYYRPELATPPLALVALLGCSELHSTVGEFLRSTHRPPINSIGVGEPTNASRLFGERKVSVSLQSQPTSILKADWFAKHRQRRPAVAVLLLARDVVLGDAPSWARCTQQADAVRGATRAQGARAVLIVVQPPNSPDLPDERALQLCKQAGIDRRCLLCLCLAEPGGLVKLGRSLHEQAGVYYLEESRRILSLHAERRSPPPELNARVSFKAAALAEFRADWSTAVKTYQTAYAQVQKVQIGTVLPLQHWYELTRVAEEVHIKVVTLLLHQHRSQEALAHFQQHVGSYRHPPPHLAPVPLAAVAAHHGWVGRQYQVMGELMSSRVDPAHLPPQRDCHPAYFFLCAATAFIERRRSAQQLREAQNPTQAGSHRVAAPAGVAPSRAVGQLVKEGGKRLTDPEFLAWLEAEEAQSNHGKVAIAMLTTAHELYKKGSQRAHRLMYHIGALLARERLACEDVESAHKLLESVAGVYRKEQWGVPLAAALLELRECAHQQRQPKAHIEYSLELACQEEFLGEPQRRAIAQAAVGALQSQTPPPSPQASPRSSESGESRTGLPLEFQVQSASSGLFSCFALQWGFAPVSPPQPDPQRGGQACFGVALWSNLPVVLPIKRLEVVFADREGTSAQTALQQAPQQSSAAQGTAGQALHSDLSQLQLQDSQPHQQQQQQQQQRQQQLVIQPQKWNVMHCEWQPRCSGKLTAQAVVAYTGDTSAIVWNLELGTGEQMVLGRAGQSLEALQNPFLHSPVAGRLGQSQLEVPSHHKAPQLQITGAGFAMVGEQMPVTLGITAAGPIAQLEVVVKAEYLEGGGHSELQILLPDAEESRPSLQVPMALPDLAGEQVHLVKMLIPVARPGQVHLSARLHYHAGQESEEVAEQVAGLEVVVEQPFTLDCQLSAPPRVQSIMPPQPEPSQFLAPGSARSGTPRGAVTLPLGPPAVMLACLTAMAPCQVIIQDIQIQPPSGGPGQAEVVAIATAVGPQQAASLRKGDKHSCVMQVQAAAAAQDLQLGHIAITWTRAGSEIHKPEWHESSVVTSLPLPLVSFQRPLLQASMVHAAEVAAGMPFVLKLTLQSYSALLQTLEVALKDSAGFVTSGPRNSIVSVLPHQDSVVAWQVVAYSSGYQPLPQIELISRQHSVLLNASHGRTVHVLPAPLPTEISLEGQSSGMVFTGGANSLASSMSHVALQPRQVLS